MREKRRKPLRRRIRALRRRVNATLLRHFGPTALRLIARTWKTEVLGQENLDAAGESGGRLIALWHGRMLVPLHHHRGMNMCVLVSPSDDGSLAVGMLTRFGQRAIRGSSSRASAGALRAMLAELDAGSSVVITPDGPRGPEHSMNGGLAWLARATGYPVVPCGFVCDRAWRLRSWDRFTIPKPGARLALVYGEPVTVSRRGGAAELEAATEEIARRMHAAEAAGFERLGIEGDG